VAGLFYVRTGAVRLGLSSARIHFKGDGKGTTQ
jgi:hypothetical protein